MRLISGLLAFLLLLGLGIGLAPEAAAHGGRFIGPPKPPMPPPIRTPPDIVPPPSVPGGRAPPDRTNPPPSIPKPKPVAPGGKAPTTPSVPVPPSTPGTPPSIPTGPTTAPGGLPTPPRPGVTPPRPGGAPSTGVPPWIRARRGQQGGGSDGWSTWWQLNRWTYLPTRLEGLERRLAAVTPTGSDTPEPAERWAQRRDVLARTVTIPTLLRYLDPKARADDEVRAAALIALGRTAAAPSHVDRIRSYASDAKQSVLVREAAAIALGMVRRSEGPRPLDAAGYDGLRRFLVAYFDDDAVPTRARAMAMLSVGLLADQPYATAFTKDGRLVTHMLWERLSSRWSHPEMPVVLLTALGLQPSAGVPQKVKDGLQQIVLGKRVNKVSWSAIERSHALTARLKLGGSEVPALLMRILPSRRVPREVKEAAWIGLAGSAHALTSKERMTLFSAFQRAYPRISDPLVRGMAQLALGRLMETDVLENADSQLLYQNMGPAFLLKEARVSTGETRGFAALALGLAARNTREGSRAGLAFRRDATALLRKMFEHDARAVNVRGAYAVALGLMDVEGTADLLAHTLADRREREITRAHCGDALALMRVDSPTVRESLKTALIDRRAAAVRASAATAWAAIAFGKDGETLVSALEEARTQREVGHIAVAIGLLGDLDAARSLVGVARDDANVDENRALALAALGLLFDPELRPSLTRLRRDGNYVARTSTLHEAFDIL
ncbi:MAG: HEAT repeat domain-containing protein [Planctomycetota bacterium]|nr:HEAT repeat domain-containing protein [Planctomycetota bacterium]